MSKLCQFRILGSSEPTSLCHYYYWVSVTIKGGEGGLNECGCNAEIVCQTDTAFIIIIIIIIMNGVDQLIN